MGTFAEPGLPRGEQNLANVDDNEFGMFNDFGDLFLELTDIPKIQKIFQPMYTYRLAFESVQL